MSKTDAEAIQELEANRAWCPEYNAKLHEQIKAVIAIAKRAVKPVETPQESTWYQHTTPEVIIEKRATGVVRYHSKEKTRSHDCEEWISVDDHCTAWHQDRIDSGKWRSISAAEALARIGVTQQPGTIADADVDNVRPIDVPDPETKALHHQAINAGFDPVGLDPDDIAEKLAAKQKAVEPAIETEPVTDPAYVLQDEDEISAHGNPPDDDWITCKELKRTGQTVSQVIGWANVRRRKPEPVESPDTKSEISVIEMAKEFDKIAVLVVPVTREDIARRTVDRVKRFDPSKVTTTEFCTVCGVHCVVDGTKTCGECAEYVVPVESPDDWVPQDRVPVRHGIDYAWWARPEDNQSSFDWWLMDDAERYEARGRRNGFIKKNGLRLHVRCRRHDLPPMPQPAEPVAERIPVRLWIKREAFDRKLGAIVFAINEDQGDDMIEVVSDGNGGWCVKVTQ